jgi:hypothetical protein
MAMAMAMASTGFLLASSGADPGVFFFRIRFF